MRTIEISEALEKKLASVAQQAGKSEVEMAHEILGDGLEELDGSNIIHSPEEIERMKHSLAQLDRGEYITNVEVDLIFAEWRRKLAAR